MSAPVAAIDVGTNSVRLLVTDGERDLARALRITRLGQGVDETRALRDDAIARTADAVVGFVEQARAAGAEAIVVGATAAVRDAANREAFMRLVEQRAGVPVTLLSGEDEARLSFAGASRSFDPAELKVVVDIGGGSTELVAGRRTVLAAVSTDAGSVRLTERHIRTDPPSGPDCEAVRADASSLLEAGFAAVRPVLDAQPVLIGVAGTCTTLAALALGLDAYDRDRVHGTRLTLERVGELRRDLAAMTIEQRGAIAVVTPGRADVIVAGALILEEAIRTCGAAAIVVSETDILDGLAATLRA